MNFASLKPMNTKISKIESLKALETVAVVGLGYVGLPLALLAERKGFSVHGIDIDTKKIEKLRGGGVTIPRF